MTELSKNSIVSLVGGETATIIKELGRGGQGIVYLVEVCGEKKALKWYLNAPDDKFYSNLAQNIASRAPSDAFLWPEYLTEKQQGSYGYIMKLRPQNYYEFGNFLLAKVSFKSFTAMLSAAMKICDGFMMLLNPAKRNVLDLKNETCKNREKRNVLKISHTRHFKTTKKQSKTGCFYSF